MTVPDAHAPLWRGLSESMSADRPRAAESILGAFCHRGTVTALRTQWSRHGAAFLLPVVVYGVPAVVRPVRPDSDYVRFARLGLAEENP